ncbi:hypothetical protein [Sphingomonas xinjiangensis]|uniref:Uncharacterized protein n=1 Tax=Sphingomonas xinjiangensis TaxID=643568 RepID=A0A840YT98_9SPHN|nr:hypothetical protein [Sphingomonas xinjiangensis]MBB5712936.1 hypothetical protein [Sphingomonas xinjiangensis]
MTTYPLSEPATIYASEEDGTERKVVGQGTLEACAEIVERLPAQGRTSACIEMDELDLKFGPDEVDELSRFLREEGAGLSNRDISAIPDQTL